MLKATKSPHTRFEFVAHSAAVHQAEIWLSQGYEPTIRQKRVRDRNGVPTVLFVVERN